MQPHRWECCLRVVAVVQPCSSCPGCPTHNTHNSAPSIIPNSHPACATRLPLQASSSKQQAEATLSLFKRGGRLPTKPAGGAGGGGGGGGGGRRANKGEQLDSISAKLERKVANCLSCGKIFDCRHVTNDIIRFIGGWDRMVNSNTDAAMRAVVTGIGAGCVRLAV